MLFRQPAVSPLWRKKLRAKAGEAKVIPQGSSASGPFQPESSVAKVAPIGKLCLSLLFRHTFLGRPAGWGISESYTSPISSLPCFPRSRRLRLVRFTCTFGQFRAHGTVEPKPLPRTSQAAKSGGGQNFIDSSYGFSQAIGSSAE
jgi:hypothetical protein